VAAAFDDDDAGWVTPVDYQPSPFARNIRQAEGSSDDQVSPAGATGQMQVMPKTAASPGFNVRPAAAASAPEVNRVGGDYADAMLAHYGGNHALAAAAYNAGPGTVEDWLSGTNKSGRNKSLTKIGDPRKGELTDEAFANAVPFKETQDYIRKAGALTPIPADTSLNPPSDQGGAPDAQDWVTPQGLQPVQPEDEGWVTPQGLAAPGPAAAAPAAKPFTAPFAGPDAKAIAGVTPMDQFRKLATPWLKVGSEYQRAANEIAGVLVSRCPSARDLLMNGKCGWRRLKNRRNDQPQNARSC